LRTVTDLAAHPLHRLDAAGVRVTINSDDPAYFGQNYTAVRDALGLTTDQAERFARTSIEASFASTKRKAELLEAVDAWRG
jgi:adenosine deaminase